MRAVCEQERVCVRARACGCVRACACACGPAQREGSGTTHFGLRSATQILFGERAKLGKTAPRSYRDAVAMMRCNEAGAEMRSTCV
eukprot:1886336-Pleurochrysis_carterae.AAC.1